MISAETNRILIYKSIEEFDHSASVGGLETTLQKDLEVKMFLVELWELESYQAPIVKAS